MTLAVEVWQTLAVAWAVVGTVSVIVPSLWSVVVFAVVSLVPLVSVIASLQVMRIVVCPFVRSCNVVRGFVCGFVCGFVV